MQALNFAILAVPAMLTQHLSQASAAHQNSPKGSQNFSGNTRAVEQLDALAAELGLKS